MNGLMPKDPPQGAVAPKTHPSSFRTRFASLWLLSVLLGWGFWLRGAVAQTSIAAWGYDASGQIDVPWITDAVAIAAGASHSLALRSDGTVVAWGSNSAGQSTVPPNLADVVAIAAGANHSLALKSDGTIAAWGDNTFGQTRIPAGLSNVVAIATGRVNSMALKNNGTVVIWGWFATGPNNVPAGLSNVVAIGAGWSQNLAVKADGGLTAWVGHVPYSPMPISVPPDLTNVVAACGISADNLALRANGTVAVWGSDNNYGQTNVPADLDNVVAISGGQYHSLALRFDGSVVAWGAGTIYSSNPHYGQSSVPAGLTNVIAVAAGGLHSLALVNDGTPFIVRPPRPQRAYTGGGTSFNVTAVGAPPLGYQWQFKGAPIPSASMASLLVTNVQLADAGLYSVIVSNGFGSITSGAPLTVTASAPFFTRQPATQSFLPHATVALQPGLEGSQPLLCQWQHEGTNLPGATNSWLIISNAQSADTGRYQLQVTNALGTAASSNAILALTHSQLVAWGDNGYGQTNVPPVLEEVLAIASGGYHSLALKRDGTVVGWGAGATTNGTGVFDYGQATVPNGLSNVVAIGARRTRSLALQRDGTVVNWGYNSGLTNTPVEATNLAMIIAGAAHNLALKADGTVLAWGDNSYGQTNVPPGLSNVVAIAGGDDHNVALKADGTLVAWGDNGYGQTNVPPNLSNVVAIGAGDYATLAVRNDGTVVAWGDRAFGETPAPAGLSNVVAAGGGTFFSLALQGDGSIVAWGDNYEGQTNLPTGLPYAVAIAGGDSHGLAVVGDGSPFMTQQPASQVVFSGMNAVFRAPALGIPPLHYQWQFQGTNIPAATGPSLALTNVQETNAGEYCVVVTNLFGSVVSLKATLGVVSAAPIIVGQPQANSAWLGTNVTLAVSAIGSWPMSYQWRFNGSDIAGATDGWLTLTNISLGDFGSYSVCVSNSFGSTVSSGATLSRITSRIIAWGQNDSRQTNVPTGLFNVTMVSAGDSHNLALKDDGTLVGWGNNYSGQTNIPAGLTNVIAVTAGSAFNLVLKRDGTVAAWGSNQAPITNVPAGLNQVVAVAAGGIHCLALRADGTVVAWGNNSDGQTNVPAGLSNVVAISAGGSHSLALKGDGTLSVWGNNLSGQSTIPPGMTNIMAIAAGGYFNLALRSNGTVVAWGYNTDGETNVPPNLSDVVAVAAGFYNGLALQKNGKIVAWGYSGYGQTNVPAGATDAVMVDGGRTHSVALLHDPSPFIRRQPASQWLSPGATARFSVDAVGVMPLSFQWNCRGQPIGGATSSSLTLTNVSSAASGNYSVTVSNAFGSVLSTDATLTFFGPMLTSPWFSSSPSSPGFGFTVQGLSGHGPLVIYSSTDLSTWNSVLTNPPTTGVVPFFDLSATNQPSRFYRAIEQ